MPWRQPQYPGEFPSLGPGIADWCERYLRWQGQPWRFTDPQYRFIVRAYRIDGYTGQLLYRRAAKIAPKGYGKSPMLAAAAVAEAAGPVRFGGWDASGEPVGVPVELWPAGPGAPPWVQLAAVSEDATDNTYAVLLSLIQDGDLADVAPGIDPGLTRTFLPHNGGRIEPVTSSAGSREGQRVTFAVLDETHLWTPGNGGVRLAATLRRNLAKMQGFSVETTNAPRPGEMSVAEQTLQAAKERAPGMLVEHVKAGKIDLADEPALRAGLRRVYEDPPWIDLDRLVNEIRDPATEEADARRFYLNEVVAPADSYIDPQAWAACAAPARIVTDGEPITLGFDGAQYEDSTALIGTCLSDGHQFEVGIWEKPDGQAGVGWQIDAEAVDAEVQATFGRYDVRLMFPDPWGDWRPYVEAWAARWPGRVQEFDTRHIVKMCRALERLEADIRRKAMTHDGSVALATHMANARRRNRGDLYVIGKDHRRSPRKIDAAVAAALSYAARQAALDKQPAENNYAEIYYR